MPVLRQSAGLILVAGAIYGLALWLVNFYVVAPVAFAWFQDADPVVQFVAHAVFFGALVGSIVARLAPVRAQVRPRRHEPLRT